MSTSLSNATSASMSSSSGGDPAIPNPKPGPIIEGAALGPIAALEQRAAVFGERAVRAVAIAREAAADAQEIDNAHATIVSQHRKMFLQRAFGITPNGTAITDPALLPEKLKKYNSF